MGYRDIFIAYFYALLYNSSRHKFVITLEDKYLNKVFNKDELALYKVINKMIEDEEHIDNATIHFEMNKKQLKKEYITIYNLATKQNYDIDRIDVYYNKILQEFSLNLFRDSKSDEELQNAIQVLESLHEMTDTSFSTLPDGLKMLMEQKGIELLKSGLKFFDDQIYLSNGIMLLAGKQGSGKTTILVELMKRVLVYGKMENRDISVQWNTMEDEIPMIVASMISREIQIQAKEIMRDSSKFKNHLSYKVLEESFNTFDIEFQDKQLSMNEIKLNWKAFLKQRKKQKAKFCILVIDNVMQLTDHGKRVNQTADDDYICNQINVCRNEAKKVFGNKYLIIVLHHLGKEQMSRINAKSCYKPNPGDIKGSSRYLDMPTVTLFVHRFFEFKDIVNEFKEYEKYLEHIMMLICSKNRQGGWVGEGYVWCDMAYKYACDFPEPAKIGS